jgi:hypothetical protein
MNTVNTKLFTIDELKYKKYGDLVNFLTGMFELVDDIQEEIDEIQLIESEDGYLDQETLNELNIMITQSDYLTKNINTTIDTLNLIEMKSFMKVENLPLVCLN